MVHVRIQLRNIHSDKATLYSNGSHTDNLVISYFAPTNAVIIRDESVREDCYDTVEDTAPRIAILP